MNTHKPNLATPISRSSLTGNAPEPTRRRAIPALATLAATLAAMALIATPALAHDHFTITGSFGAPGEGAGELSLMRTHELGGGGLAIDNETQDIYVADTGNNRVDEFHANGTFIRAFGADVGGPGIDTCTSICSAGAGGIAPGALEAPVFVAVDNDPSSASFGDVYVADAGENGESPKNLVAKFDADGNPIKSWGVEGQLNGSSAPEGTFGQPVGIAVDSSGDLWVYVGSTSHTGNDYMYEFDQGDTFLQSWANPSGSAGFPVGIAIDGSGDLYLVDSQGVHKLNPSGGEIGIVTRSSATSGGSGFETGIAVDPVSNEIYADIGSSIERIASSCAPSPIVPCAVAESFGAPGLTGGGELAVDSTTGAVYAVEPESDRIAFFTPEVPTPPAIEDQSVTSVTAGSATFSANIDPDGPPTEYWFEYGPTAAYGELAPLAHASVGSGFDGQEVSVHIQGLLASTTYYFRVVAKNQLGTVYGEEDQTFATQRADNALALPDGRSWELVTPPDKQGALFEHEGPIQAAADGDAIMDLADRPTEAEPQGYANQISVLSTRGAGGWSSQVIAPPHRDGAGASVGRGAEYRLFSSDLSRALLQPFGDSMPLSPQASEATAYLRSDYLNGNVEEHCEASYLSSSSCFTPLVTDKAGYANDTASPFEPFGEEPDGVCGEGNNHCGPQIEGASPDLSHVVLWSPVPLTSEPGAGPGLYEWSAGHLQFLGAGDLAGSGAKASGDSHGTAFVGEEDGARHAVSADGERVIDGLSLLEVPTGTTVQLAAAEPGCGTCGSGGTYQTASADDSRIFFLSAEHLTRESSPSGSDLYEYDLNASPAGRLTDLTVAGAGEPANVAKVIGASEDGSYVYFAAGGALAAGAAHGECPPGSGADKATGECNIYVRHNGTTTLVAKLSAKEEYRDWGAELQEVTARVSPNGQWLAFMSSKNLTGYDTRDAISGRLDQEVYLYGASSNGLICASCNPTGARPVGVDTEGGGLVERPERASTAADVPGWTPLAISSTRYQSRYLSSSGRLFFDSNDALVPQDVNGTEDVYEYEPAGVGSCTSEADTYHEKTGGCTSLISSGTSAEESAFLDASETGGDVFFLTTSKLAPQDFDNAYDVYDAHECTTAAPCFPAPVEQPPACTTESSCRAAPSPQPSLFGSPPSATFSGAGNVAAPAAPALKPKAKPAKCKKGFVKNKKSKCVRKKSTRKAKKSTNRKGSR
jgi:hypothetical protein